MRRFPKLRPTGWDGLVAAIVLVLAAACAAALWAPGTAGDTLTVVVSVDGVERERFPLADAPAETTYTNNGYTLHVRFSAEGAAVETADCPTQDCVHTGTISRPGQSIVCLPARVILQLEGAADGGVDAVIG